MQKSLSDFNNKAWYRLIKVLFVCLFLIITSVTLLLIYDENQYSVTLDKENTKIVCNYGNKKVFSLNDIDIYLTKEDIEDFSGKLPESWRKFGTSQDSHEYIPNSRFEYLDNKKSEIQSWCNVSEKEHDEYIATLRTIYSDGQKTGDYKKLWEIKPAYEEKGGLITIIWLSLAAFAVIALTFEIIKRVFYYVVLGSFLPKK